jgi:dTDP-4-dehydrorhamnose reductase
MSIHLLWLENRMSDILILGARSWVGFRIAQALESVHQVSRIIGTSSAPHESYKSDSKRQPFVTASSPDEFLHLLRSIRPVIVLNLLRGESRIDFQAHSQLAHACSEMAIRYVYISSALALDGYPTNVSLTEDLPALSRSSYGQFKAECESHLLRIYPTSDWMILRFCSIQGWSPWRPNRNEIFLSKLARGETITVDSGVKQNRLLDIVFASAVVELIFKNESNGVYHLGATSSSDEIDFLRAQAALFGWDEGLVCAGNQREVNLDLSCSRLHDATCGRWRRTEGDTLDGLLAMPDLRRFQNTR